MLNGEYHEGGLKVPDIWLFEKALKFKQFARMIESAHPIKNIQRYIIESLDYDKIYQQEYCTISDLDCVTAVAQNTINILTDKMRKVNTGSDTKSDISYCKYIPNT
jgi:hypothetical protein